jgi:anti-sigma factor RsiW
MSCSNYDWKAYALGELDSAARHDAEAHASTCASCHEELAALRLTLDTLSVLRDEEVPRRIAFVSDKVFEPRWWQRLWSPAFAGACVIAAAIAVHGFATAGPGPKAIQAQVNAAVAQAVAQVEARQVQQTEEMMNAYDLLSKQFRQVYKQTSGLVLQ